MTGSPLLRRLTFAIRLLAVAGTVGTVTAALTATRGNTQACAPPLTIGCPTTTTSPEPEPTTTVPPSTTTTTEPPATEPASAPTDTTFALTTDTTPAAPDFTTPVTAAPATVRPVARPGLSIGPITPAAVTGSYGIGVGSVLLAGLVPIAFASRIRRGGTPMNDPKRRWRMIAALGCIALAAVIGLVGYLKLSLEPAVNRQIPYLASAGMALVLLAAIGGSLLVAEQIRADDDRIDQLERSVRILAEALGPDVEAPARRPS